MEKQYTITGMTCGGCVANVKKALESISSINSAQIQLTAPQGVLTFENEIPETQLQQKLRSIGNYAIKELKKTPKEGDNSELPKKSISTYKPLILIVVFIAAISGLAQYPSEAFSGMLWMRYFMAGFFIVFAFFKLLNINGFANAYRMYDIVAAKWKNWGYIYPFVELTLGILYLLNIAPFKTNLATIIILGVSSIGVIKSNIDKKKIKCACLGDVFNLPMSTVTIAEDLTMVAMALFMLLVV